MLGLPIQSATLAPVSPTTGSSVVLQPWENLSASSLYPLSWLLPLGLALIALGMCPPRRRHDLIPALPLALVAGLSGYLLSAYALMPVITRWIAHLGPGIEVPSLLPAPDSLAQANLARDPQLYWGMLTATMAALCPLIIRYRGMRTLSGLGIATLAAMIIPGVEALSLTGGEVWMQSGQGPAVAALVGAGITLAGILALRRPTPTPRASHPRLPMPHEPYFVALGMVCCIEGGGAWILALTGDPSRAAARLLVLPLLCGLGGAMLAALLYALVTEDRPSLGLAAYAVISTLLALSMNPTATPTQSLILGVIVGAAIAPCLYLVREIARRPNESAVLSVLGLPALLGWGAATILEPEKMRGQLVGLAAIAIFSIVMPWALLRSTRALVELPTALGHYGREQRIRAQRRRAARHRATAQGRHLAVWQIVRRRLLARDAAPRRRLSHRTGPPR